MSRGGRAGSRGAAAAATAAAFAATIIGTTVTTATTAATTTTTTTTTTTRSEYGESPRRWWGDLSASETRALYHSLLPTVCMCEMDTQYDDGYETRRVVYRVGEGAAFRHHATTP